VVADSTLLLSVAFGETLPFSSTDVRRETFCFGDALLLSLSVDGRELCSISATTADVDLHDIDSSDEALPSRDGRWSLLGTAAVSVYLRPYLVTKNFIRLMQAVKW